MKNNSPYILEENDDYAVVFKPPKIHSTVKNNSFNSRDNERHHYSGGNNTLFDWYLSQSSSVYDIMHRLDYETHGLVLFAKNKASFQYFKSLQDNGGFIKEYSAVCAGCSLNPLPGFPSSPVINSLEEPFKIESRFRPYGRGRKQVRPVTDGGKKNKELASDKKNSYITEITAKEGNVFTAQIKRGFRHQIRCHLCWIGFPVKNDPLYPHEKTDDCDLALRAQALFFSDPSGNKREIRIDSLKEC